MPRLYRQCRHPALSVLAVIFLIVVNASALNVHVRQPVSPNQANVVALLPPSNLTIHYLGRTLLVPKSGGEEEHVAYDFSMVTISVGVNVSAISSNNTIAARFRFQCMNAAGEPARKGNRIQIKLNGVPLGSNPVIDMGTSAMQAKCNTIVSVPLFTTDQALASLGGTSTSQVATLSLVKLTEPDYNGIDFPAGKDNSIRFYGLEVTDPNPNSTVANMFVQPVNLSSSSHRFQIVGDSITAGYQIMCPANNRLPLASYNMSSPSSYALENVTATYSGRTCAEFGAECHVEAWSGRGAVQNNDLSIVTTMAVIATRTIGSLQCPTTSSTCNNTWSYPASWIPTAILYNLGTNDFAHGRHPEKFTEGVVAMITNLVSKYAPHIPPVVLQCGPMNYEYCPELTEATLKLATLISNPIHVYEHPAILNNTNNCNGHPDVEVSTTLAKAFTAYLKNNVLAS